MGSEGVGFGRSRKDYLVRPPTLSNLSQLKCWRDTRVDEILRQVNRGMAGMAPAKPLHPVLGPP